MSDGGNATRPASPASQNDLNDPNDQASPSGSSVVSRHEFGALPDGRGVDRWVLDDGILQVSILTYGGIIQQLWAPDRDGRRTDVVLGFDDVLGYLGEQPFHGAIVGRFANHIAGASFELDGTTYQLVANNGPNHLHGGPDSWNTRIWTAHELPGRGVRLTLLSPDGDGGYPARLEVAVDYTLADGALTIHYATTNAEPAGGRATVLNLTNHAYLNLAGHAAGSVGDHVVQVPANRFVVAGADLIPTGEIASVEGRPLDLRPGRRLADVWDADDEQLAAVGGFDVTYVLDDAHLPDDAAPGSLVPAARITEPTSGRILEVATDQPGSHLYSGNMMEPRFAGKGGRRYGRREGLCVETQHFPDSPHHPSFPSTVVAAGATVTSTTRFSFSAG